MEDCKPIDEQKKTVDKQIAAYEALQLPPLKKELDALVDKKTTAVDEYKKLYEGRKKRWCEQNEKIERLYTSFEKPVSQLEGSGPSLRLQRARRARSPRGGSRKAR